MKVAIICPVRNLTSDEAYEIERHILKLQKNGVKVHYPPRDTNQADPIGFKICKQNAEAIIDADEVHIFWNGKSKGSMFDLGMAFIINKKIVLINKLQETPHKSFENVLLYVSNHLRWRV